MGSEGGTINMRRIAMHAAGMGRACCRRLGRQPERVLLLCSGEDSLGDLVLVSGTLRHYRKLYDGALLELGCPDRFMEVFQDCSSVDTVYPLSHYHRMRNGTMTPSLLNAGRYDRVILLRRTPRAEDYYLLESFVPARFAGFAGDHLRMAPGTTVIQRGERRLHYSVQVSLKHPPAHQLDMHLALLRELGASLRDVNGIWPVLPSRPEDKTLIDGWLRGMPESLPVIVCAPCGAFPFRNWAPEELCRVFEALSPCVVVLTGLSADSRFAMSMALHQIPGVRLINLMGQTRIGEFIETIRRAHLFIGAESAAFHVAAALRRPAICLAGGGHWGRFVPWGMPDRTRVLTHHLDCFGCDWKCCRPTVECIQKIRAEEVVQAAKELLTHQLTHGGDSP